MERTAAKLWPKQFRRIWEHHVKNNQKEISKAMVGKTAAVPSVELLMRSLETCDKCGLCCHKGRDCPFESESPTKGRVGSKSFTVSLTPEKRAERMAIFKELEAAMRKEKPVAEPDQIKDLKETTPAWQVVQAYRSVEAAFKAKVKEFTRRISAKLVVADKDYESAMRRQMNALEAAKASAAAAISRKEKAAAKQAAAIKAAEAKRNAAKKAAERAAEAKRIAAHKAAERAAEVKRIAAQKAEKAAEVQRIAAQKAPEKVSNQGALPSKTGKSPGLVRYIDSGPAAGWHVKGRAYPTAITMWVLPPNGSVWLSRVQALKELEESDPKVIEAIDRVRWQVQQELKGRPVPVAQPVTEGGTRKKLRLSWSEESHRSCSSSSSSVRVLS